jgi:hypothetical protein
VKYLAAVSLVLVFVVLPACAQRGASHGGFSGHAAGVSRGGFAASAPARSSGYRGYTAHRAPGFARGFQRGVAPGPLARSPYTGNGRYRRPYVPHYRAGISYGVPGYGWVSPYSLGYPDDFGFDDSTDSQDNGAANASADVPEGYEAGPPDQYPAPYPGQEQPLAPYQPGPETARPGPAPASEQAVTLIFKDGRPPEQIHNYLLTRTTLFVGDQHRRAIPTDELDLAATAKANQDEGVDFQLPNATR